jgi:hypothetical protein
MSRHGTPDIVIANAASPRDLTETAEDPRFREILDINVLAW